MEEGLGGVGAGVGKEQEQEVGGKIMQGGLAEEQEARNLRQDLQKRPNQQFRFGEVGGQQTQINLLANNLKAIFIPTTASSFTGSYISGKKINMKRLI